MGTIHVVDVESSSRLLMPLHTIDLALSKRESEQQQ